MKELVMEVKHFFNIEKRGIKYTVLGGQLACNIKKNDIVEIVCPGDALITDIIEIKCHKDSLEEALQGLSCGLVFFGIHHMAFRTTEPIVNPYSPKDNLAKYLEWDSNANEAEGVMIYRETKPSFLFLHGEGYDS